MAFGFAALHPELEAAMLSLIPPALADQLRPQTLGFEVGKEW